MCTKYTGFYLLVGAVLTQYTKFLILVGVGPATPLTARSLTE